MRSRRPAVEHQEAVSRRLALLSQELASITPERVHSHGSAAVPAPEPVPLPEDGHTVVRRPAVAEAPVEPPPVPEVGRHAARRVTSIVMPEGLLGRVALGPAQLVVVAVVVAAGLAATAWWVARAEPRTVAAPVVGAPPVTSSPSPAVPAASGSPAAGEVTVDVAGRVRRPGIVVLPTGSRVVDALEAAGGARSGVDLSALNLARLLVDGEQVLVGVPVPAGVVGSLGSSPAPAPGALVNLNTATQAELETLPEVGPVTAQAIIAWRTDSGGFSSVEELLEVDGIGEATLATMAPLVTV